MNREDKVDLMMAWFEELNSDQKNKFWLLNLIKNFRKNPKSRKPTYKKKTNILKLTHGQFVTDNLDQKKHVSLKDVYKQLNNQ